MNSKDINPFLPLWQLSVGQFIELQKELLSEKSENKYVYGMKGLAKILGCSLSTANKIKKSGILDGAISQQGKIIIIDKELALELFNKNNKK
ncbi:hypothetical protein CAPN002_00300 [Capnocytophaga stomatis]|uniref:DUF3853 family protein n=1 Tax=Capnocytophaga stomatis TaxID=1848904 RepID=UPI001951EDCA|nr:DUF3853 family protein [Capnocytophaga stomatis]GIJ92812.1 hypothetical protein CAPN002_00300 [Capnocytophaga stomatis]